jgi:hypothetical protein
MCAPFNILRALIFGAKKQNAKMKLVSSITGGLTEGTYADHKPEMKENRILHSYELSKSIKYRKAYAAIKAQDVRITTQRELKSAASDADGRVTVKK